jgi:hypothetical protein
MLLHINGKFTMGKLKSSLLSKIWTTSHKVSIEHARWKNITLENRKCKLCNSEEIGDEFHYILILYSPYFKQYRYIFIYQEEIYKSTKYY